MSSAPLAALRGLNWSHTPATIAAEQARLIARATGIYDAIANEPSPSFETVIMPLVNLDVGSEADGASITFLKDVHVDKEVRDAAAAAQTALSAFEIAAGMREDVYASFAKAAAGTDVAALSPELRRFVEKTARDYRRKGMELPSGPRAELEAIKTLLSDKCIAFQASLGAVDTKLRFPESALNGMPADFVASLSQDGEERIVTLAYPHVLPILKQCTVASTRAAVEKAFNSRCVPGNAKLLEEIVQLRRYAASILGYPSHSAFVLEDRMASTPATVEAFLATLREDLKPLLAADIAKLSALKTAAEGEGAGPLNMADRMLYQEQDLATTFAVDHDALKSYFPLEVVLSGMLGLYAEILSLRFELLPSAVGGGPGVVSTWHEDVQAYAVYDDSGRLHEEEKGVGWCTDAAAVGELMGVFLLDLHPRAGKYGHAAVFPLVSGCADGQGGRVVPVAACVCNFTKPTGGAPSLLRHEEVETFFHEFGHVMHHVCSRTVTQRFASFKVENDFVEAPSQMLENWVWAGSLARMSGHHKDGSPIPADLVAALSKSQIAHSGLFNSRQVMLATLDFQLHNLAAVPPPRSFVGTTAATAVIDVPPEVAAAPLLERLHTEVLRIPITPGTNFAASFGHLCGGYDSQYYGYLWSEVYAADMFSTAFEKALTSPAAGWRWRSCILAPGGGRDAMDSLTDFLGRPPSNAAFLKSKGL